MRVNEWFGFSMVSLNYVFTNHMYNTYLPTPPLGQDMTQGHFLSRV